MEVCLSTPHGARRSLCSIWILLRNGFTKSNKAHLPLHRNLVISDDHARRMRPGTGTAIALPSSGKHAVVTSTGRRCQRRLQAPETTTSTFIRDCSLTAAAARIQFAHPHQFVDCVPLYPSHIAPPYPCHVQKLTHPGGGASETFCARVLGGDTPGGGSSSS